MERSASPSAADPSGTVEKALDVLFHLHAEGAARGVTAVARALGLPKSSAHRLLAALSRRRLVEQDEAGRYRPGLGLVPLGLGVLDREPVIRAARPLLEAESRALSETLFLTGARDGVLIVLDKVEGRGFLRAAPRIGETVPLHATAVGRLHLAFAPESVNLPGGALPRFTSDTTSSRAALARAVARAHHRGWDENREEWTPGLVVVAAPVLVAGRLVATIAVGAPSVRLPRERTAAVATRLVAAARRIAARLEGATSEDEA